MARGFRRSGSGYRCRLEPEEAALIRQLAEEVATLISAEAGGAGEPGEPTDRDAALTGDATADDLDRLVGLPAQPPPRPSDPVMGRLFPDAYADESAAAEFRRFTQSDLSAGKVAALEALRASIGERGGDVSLDGDAAELWLTALNDLRLTLGTLVGVTEDNSDELAELPPGDPRAGLFDVYDFLTYLQGTLVEAVAGW